MLKIKDVLDILNKNTNEKYIVKMRFNEEYYELHPVYCKDNYDNCIVNDFEYEDNIVGYEPFLDNFTLTDVINADYLVEKVDDR